MEQNMSHNVETTPKGLTVKVPTVLFILISWRKQKKTGRKKQRTEAIWATSAPVEENQGVQDLNLSFPYAWLKHGEPTPRVPLNETGHYGIHHDGG